MRGCPSLVGGRPAKPSNIDWSRYRQYVYTKYRKTWAVSVYAYSRKYYHLLDNVRDIEMLPPTIKTNVIKSLIVLAKYLGIYKQVKSRLEDYGIKTTRPDAFSSFLRIFNNANTSTLNWFRRAVNVLRPNEKMFLKFCILSGLRKQEAIESFNLIIELAKYNNLKAYYNEELNTLEHFRYRQLFLRQTKNVFISFIHKDLIDRIDNNNQVSYNAITKRLTRQGLNCRINELRDYYGTFMVRHGLIREEVDLLQGRISPNIFIRHYWSPSFKDLRDRTLNAISLLERSL